MGVVLYGFKAIGKSSLAAVVPLPPSYCHLDSDQLLLDHCQQENIADCYQRLGESRFRDLEQQLLLNLSSRRGSILLSLLRALVIELAPAAPLAVKPSQANTLKGKSFNISAVNTPPV